MKAYLLLIQFTLVLSAYFSSMALAGGMPPYAFDFTCEAGNEYRLRALIIKYTDSPLFGISRFVLTDEASKKWKSIREFGFPENERCSSIQPILLMCDDKPDFNSDGISVSYTPTSDRAEITEIRLFEASTRSWKNIEDTDVPSSAQCMAIIK